MPSGNAKAILNAIESRHCKRKFLDKPVDTALLERVLLTAGNAPSSKNTQPWQVAIVTGQMRTQLSDTLCRLFDAGISEKSDYQYSFEPLPAEWMDRARACGYDLFKLKNIAKDDLKKRKAHHRENYEFFGAPAVLLFHLPKGAHRGNFLDMGLFLQNVMLGLVGLGLGSCPQQSLTMYSKTIKKTLNLKNRLLVCGLSVGYPDLDAIVNTYIPQRLPLSGYTQWYS